MKLFHKALLPGNYSKRQSLDTAGQPRADNCGVKAAREQDTLHLHINILLWKFACFGRKRNLELKKYGKKTSSGVAYRGAPSKC